jgi:transcriptional regulator with XRE-family HTH domain
MNRLKELREEAMLTVRELSERSGVSEDTITKIENGHRKGRSMTLRKLAKALGVRLHELSPEHSEQTTEAEANAPEILPQHKHRSVSFELSRENSPVPEALQNADILEEAISRVYEVTRAIHQPVEQTRPKRGHPDAVPRMTISERQQEVLIALLECGEVFGPAIVPAIVADQLKISVSTAYSDLTVLEEHGLVMADESGERLISPLGRDLVEAIMEARSKLPLNKALSRIATLMEVYNSVAKFDPDRASDEDVASFFRLQELIVQSIRRIAALTEPPRLANQVQQNIVTGKAGQKDAVDYAQAVQSVMRLLMPNPPALSRIREDLEGSTEEQIREVLDLVVTISPGDYDSYDPSNPYKQFCSVLAFKVGTSLPPYRTVQRDEADSAQHATMRDVD